ncbi:MAG TPA: TM2 domain-containing protein [Gemmatimonadales bacterium]|jgi:TM2 domain-containing membrane protein YozV|nr:TM2 domain-containing protein [Gemmatimonadales bacterium]
MTETETETSPKTRLTALLLAMFTGVFGGHRFYAGKPGTAILMCCTLGGVGLWWCYDVVTILTGEFTDGRGKPIVRWTADEQLGWGAPSEQVLFELDQVRGELGELHERVDFLERMLAEAREQLRLPPSR